MLSLSEKNTINLLKNPSLKVTPIMKYALRKRVFFLPPGFARGSMTLEASILLPLFLFFVLSLMLSIEYVKVQTNIWEALHQGYSLDYEQSAAANSKTDAASMIQECYQKQDSAVDLVEYIFVETKDLGEGITKYQVTYELKPFIYFLPVGNTHFVDYVIGHDFRGYTGSFNTIGQSSEEYVYITETGTKYHQVSSCRALKITICTTLYSEMKSMRNQSGSKYVACRYCHPGKAGTIYFTREGACFHAQADCPSLKRTIFTISKREAVQKGYTACKWCSS